MYLETWSPCRFLTKDKLFIVVRVLQCLIVQLFNEKLTFSIYIKKGLFLSTFAADIYVPSRCEWPNYSCNFLLCQFISAWMSLSKLNHKVTKLSITVFFHFNEFYWFKWSVHHCKTNCLRARHCCSINYKIWTDGNCLVSTPHTCVNGVFFEGGSCTRVVDAKGINSLAAQPGFVEGALILSGWQIVFHV